MDSFSVLSKVTAEAGREGKRLDRVAPNPDRKYLFWVMQFSSPGFSSMTGFANALVVIRMECLFRKRKPSSFSLSSAVMVWGGDASGD